MVAAPTSLVVNNPTTVTITAKDYNENVITAYANTLPINLTQNGAGSAAQITWGGAGVTDSGTTGTLASGNFVAGVATVTLINQKAEGPVVITVTEQDTGTSRTGNTTVSTTDVTWTPGPLDHFVVAVASPQGIGATFTAVSTVTAQDLYNNVVTTFDASADNVTMTTTLAGTISGLGSGADAVLNQASDFVNGVADLNALGMKYVGATGAGTFTATSASTKTGVSGAVTMNVGPLDHFVVSISSPQQAGLAFTGANTITAKDASDNTITTFDASTNNVTITNTLGGTVTGLGSGANNVLNQAADFVAGVADLTALGMTYSGTSGVGTFTVTSANAKTGVSGAVTVNPGLLDHFALTIAAQQVGVPFTGVNTISAKDSSNNTITTFDASADNVTLTCTGGTITGLGSGANAILNQAADFNLGVADLTALAAVFTGTAGTGKTCTATAGTSGKTGTTGATVAINIGPLDHFVVAMASPQTSGVVVTGVNTITAYDAGNKVITGYDASVNNVTVTSSLGGTITGLGTGSDNILNQASDFVKGVATLTLLGMKYTGPNGTGTFTATSSGKTGTSGNVTIGAGALDHFTVSINPGQAVDTVISVGSITAEDASNNVITTFDASITPVTITTNVPGASVIGLSGGNILNSAGDFVSGVADLNLRGMKYVGATNPGVIFTATGGGKTGVSGSVDFGVGPLDHFVFAVTTPQTSGVAFTGVNTLTAQDKGNNVLTAFDASANNVTVTCSLGGTVSGLGSADDNVLNQAGDFTLGIADLTAQGIQYDGVTGACTLTATSADAKTGTSSAITINPGAIASFTVSASPTSVGVGSATVITITAKDALGSVKTDYQNVNPISLTMNGTGTADEVIWAGTGVTDNGTTGSLAAGNFTNGVAIVTLVDQKVEGPITITVTEADSGGKTGNTNASGTDVTWTAAAIDHFSVSASPTTLEAGAVTTITIVAKDKYDNTITTGYTNPNGITLSMNGTGNADEVIWAGTGVTDSGTGATLAVGNFTNGVAYVTLADQKAEGPITITATEVGANGKTGNTGVSSTNVTWTAITSDITKIDLKPTVVVPPTTVPEGADPDIPNDPVVVYVNNNGDPVLKHTETSTTDVTKQVVINKDTAKVVVFIYDIYGNPVKKGKVRIYKNTAARVEREAAVSTYVSEYDLEANNTNEASFNLSESTSGTYSYTAYYGTSADPTAVVGVDQFSVTYRALAAAPVITVDSSKTATGDKKLVGELVQVVFTVPESTPSNIKWDTLTFKVDGAVPTGGFTVSAARSVLQAAGAATCTHGAPVAGITTVTCTWNSTGATPGQHSLSFLVSNIDDVASVEQTVSVMLIGGATMFFQDVHVMPNPFKVPGNGYITFQTGYVAGQTGVITVEIYSSTGRLVKTLTHVTSTGFNRIKWDGKDMGGNDVAAGIYFYRLVGYIAGQGVETKGKIAVIK